MNSKEQKRETKDTNLCNNPWKVVLLNIVAMLGVGMVLIWLVMALLRTYTRHNQSFPMPDVAGMTQDEAREALSRVMLRMEITDSVYNETIPPGVVIESTPKAGSMIKKNRTVFVLVNNTQVKQLQIPDIHEISRRQAEALLRGTGFVNVTVKYVAGTFHDLALYLKDPAGRILNVGDRIPYNTPLILEVTNSEMMNVAIRDSLISAGIEESQQVHQNDELGNSGEDWF